MIDITKNEVRFDYAKSGGAGGQNVNKRNTQVTLFFNVPKSSKLTKEEKLLLLCQGCSATNNSALRKIWNRLNASGDIVIKSSKERTLEANKQEALNILNQELKQALKTNKSRILKTPKKVIRKRKTQTQKEKLLKYKRKKSLKI